MSKQFLPVNGGDRRRQVRVIPVLTIDGRGRLVKTVRFNKPAYIGDPINAVKVFNTKEVDELVLLDIDATTDKREPRYEVIEDIVGEAFMPIAYGGGIHSMDTVLKLYHCGIEKVVLSSALESGFGLVSEISQRFGAQAVAVCLPVTTSLFGNLKVRVRSGSRNLKCDPLTLARQAVEAGAGEIIVSSIDRDGTWVGYDLSLIKEVADAVPVPVVACGGAGSLRDFPAAVDAGASAVAASSFFIYQAKGRGVLISYPPPVRFSEDANASNI